MDEVMGLNSDTYRLDATTSSAAISLAGDELASINVGAEGFNVILQNTGSDNVLALAGIGSAATAVYPTSAGAPVRGTVIPFGGIPVIYKVPRGTTHISLISKSGTNEVIAKLGSGR